MIQTNVNRLNSNETDMFVSALKKIDFGLQESRGSFSEIFLKKSKAIYVCLQS